jgi:hypothetical protein
MQRDKNRVYVTDILMTEHQVLEKISGNTGV